MKLPEHVVAEATSASGAIVTFEVTARDRMDRTPTVVCTPASGSQFPIGRTAVSCTATDDAGNVGKGKFLVSVRDTTPPVITRITPTIGAVSAHMFPLTLAVTVTDAVDAAPACRITHVDGDERGPHWRWDDEDEGRWTRTGPLSLSLQADDNDGRPLIYTIVVKCRDDEHNAGSETIRVTAPVDPASKKGKTEKNDRKKGDR